MKFIIDNFGVSNLFGKDNYEFYARITGRILKVEEDWIFSFRYPPDTIVSSKYIFLFLYLNIDIYGTFHVKRAEDFSKILINENQFIMALNNHKLILTGVLNTF